MAGKGERTGSLGAFKPLIEVAGYPIIFWMLLSIRRHLQRDDTLILITTNYFANRYHLDAKISRILAALECSNPWEIVTVPETPPGPAATVYSAKSVIDSSQPVTVINCDQYIDFEMPSTLGKPGGFLPIYAEWSGKSSYVQLEEGCIIKIVEKQNISNLASAGVYGVSDGGGLIWAIEQLFKSNHTYKGEFFVGPALNYLIQNQYTFTPTPIRMKYDLGSLHGIDNFQEFITNLGWLKQFSDSPWRQEA